MKNIIFVDKLNSITQVGHKSIYRIYVKIVMRKLFSSCFWPIGSKALDIQRDLKPTKEPYSISLIIDLTSLMAAWDVFLFGLTCLVLGKNIIIFKKLESISCKSQIAYIGQELF